MRFPGAAADRAEAQYVIQGAPLDVSTTFQPGTRFGPDRVRRFARTFDDYDHRTGRRFSECGVHDAGNVRAWDDGAEYLDHLTSELRATRIEDAVPVLIGGEHTVSWAGVRATAPDVFVAVDAHLDLRTDYDGNHLSHACVTRRVLEGAPGTSAVDGTSDEPPTVEEAVILGARTGSAAEWDRAAETDVEVVRPEEVTNWQPRDDWERDDSRRVYLSVDIDGVDPGIAPGTGTMEPFGLIPREVRDLVRAVAPSCVGFDVVEVNDRDDGQTAALAGKLLREFVYAHADSRSEG